mgnify:CR=1 FL=1
MAGKQLTEQEVLEILDIPIPTYVKDKVMKFASELPNMDPQVAKTALLQFLNSPPPQEMLCLASKKPCWKC